MKIEVSFQFHEKNIIVTGENWEGVVYEVLATERGLRRGLPQFSDKAEKGGKE